MCDGSLSKAYEKKKNNKTKKQHTLPLEHHSLQLLPSL